MTSQVTSLLLDTIQDLLPANAPRLDLKCAHEVTLQSLNLDSLDTLKLAMDLEEALDMDIEIVNFPETLTLEQLAERLSAMREKKASRALLNAV